MNRIACLVSIVGVSMIGAVSYAAPVVINGSGSSAGINGGFGDVIGAGSTFDVTTDLAGNVSIQMNFGPGNVNDRIVIYIDTDNGSTGVSSTSTLTDHADPLRRAISGSTGSNASDLTFAPGFAADVAIGIETGFSGLWNQLGVDPSNHNFVAGVGGSFASGDASHIVNFTLANLGLNPGDSFRFVATLLNSEDSFRSDEFHGVAGSTVSGNVGQNPISLATGDYNVVNSIPEPASLALMGLGGLLMLRRRGA